jgi:hydroxyacylglutathione hydrolase
MKERRSARTWPVPDRGLGNSSYLTEVADGLALAVDPGRDPRPYLEIAAANGLRIAFTADTHLHADFVSGSRELAGLGARLLGPAAARLAFPHEPLRAGQELDLGGLTLRALATPGHTPEHLAYLLLDGGTPVAVFTGGALIPGGVARTDLQGAAHAEAWTRAAYRSARSLLDELPDDLDVYPTHGPGSFCAPGESGEHATTIGAEKAGNPLLAGADEAAFTRALLAGLGSYPAYFDRTPAVNGRGAPRYGVTRPPLPKLTAAHLAELAGNGATIMDARPIAAFAAAHIPGSLSNELRPAFSTWLGWLADPEAPLAVVLEPGQDRDELVEACLKAGYDNLAGELDGGIDAWKAAALPAASIPLLEPGPLEMQNGYRVVDVRQRAEWSSGHLCGAIHAELGSLADPAAAARLPTGPLAVMCAHGERSMTAASLLAAGGFTGLSVLRGGPADWASASGVPLVTGYAGQ